MRSDIYIPGDKVLVCRINIENSSMKVLIEPCDILNHDECPKIVAVDQDGLLKRYATSQTTL